MKVIMEHGYIAHVVALRKEADNKRRHPERKARRWVVEVCHSWFNRFRKLLVRYEKAKCRYASTSFTDKFLFAISVDTL